MLQMVPIGARSGMFFVTFDQCPPPSFVTLTCPSLVPVQRMPCFTGEAAIEYNTAASYVYRLSCVMPPESPWWLLSFNVKSGLIVFQVWPPSVVSCTYWLPTYTCFESKGEIVSGMFQWH